LLPGHIREGQEGQDLLSLFDVAPGLLQTVGIT
jgi:hypothetical protein